MGGMMGGTVLGTCRGCGATIDVDPLLFGPHYCDDCLEERQAFDVELEKEEKE
jgi:hypothetical protein